MGVTLHLHFSKKLQSPIAPAGIKCSIFGSSAFPCAVVLACLLALQQAPSDKNTDTYK